jgi:hypothetical protein
VDEEKSSVCTSLLPSEAADDTTETKYSLPFNSTNRNSLKLVSFRKLFASKSTIPVAFALEGLYSISQDLESSCIISAVESKLFKACVESTFAYNAVTWALTDTLSRKLDVCYTDCYGMD